MNNFQSYFNKKIVIILTITKEDKKLKLGFYKESILELEAVIEEITARLEVIRKYRKIHNDRDPIEYIISRIKSEESMIEKLKRKGLEVNLENALTKIHDAAGIRIICPFADDVYDIVKMIKKYDDIKVIKEKDYIKNPKENGYRSYHLILKVPLNIAGVVHKIFLEVQIRTIAMDFWASLEHQMKYKKNIQNQKMIVEELKKCAEQIATTDINMIAIRNMINKG